MKGRDHFEDIGINAEDNIQKDIKKDRVRL
jgi:hypothetical protein